VDSRQTQILLKYPFTVINENVKYPEIKKPAAIQNLRMSRIKGKNTPLYLGQAVAYKYIPHFYHELLI